MINYNRLVYEIKRDLSNFSEKISKGLKRPQKKICPADALWDFRGEQGTFERNRTVAQ